MPATTPSSKALTITPRSTKRQVSLTPATPSEREVKRQKPELGSSLHLNRRGPSENVPGTLIYMESDEENITVRGEAELLARVEELQNRLSYAQDAFRTLAFMAERIHSIYEPLIARNKKAASFICNYGR